MESLLFVVKEDMEKYIVSKNKCQNCNSTNKLDKIYCYNCQYKLK